VIPYGWFAIVGLISPYSPSILPVRKGAMT
jgi:hypothetical protein